VIVAVPAATPVTRPVDALTVAMPVAPLDHVPPDVVEENVVVPATQMAWVPLNVPAEGGTVRVMVPVAVVVPPVQPVVRVTVYVPEAEGVPDTVKTPNVMLTFSPATPVTVAAVALVL
jgi:hypothetical protein